MVQGFLGPLQVTITPGNDAELKIGDGPWTNQPANIQAGQTLRVRHTSGAVIGEARESTVTVGLPSGASPTRARFRTVTSEPDVVPDDFDFGSIEGVPGNTWIESPALELNGFNLPVGIEPGPHAQYPVDGGPWTDADGTLEPGQTLQVRHVSNRPSNSVRNSHVKVGGVKGDFRTRTA